ncbi:hypothetical protein KBY55_16605 [Streptomyces sp. b94]|uniref:hypothetical protein n=1 Tax=Streptomyces sp. b94 TaxID=1827634 RepID=UPI001B36F85B|nr:hypothetical protein [Streptomyces sp. b94]MBQ1097667.1 hypothetical protein [Streptomyces sp. b94]
MRGALARAVASALGIDTVLHAGPGHAAHPPARADDEGSSVSAPCCTPGRDTPPTRRPAPTTRAPT